MSRTHHRLCCPAGYHRQARRLLTALLSALLLCACEFTHRQTADLLRIERSVGTQPDSAHAAIAQLPTRMPHGWIGDGMHTPHCLARLYLYQAAHVLRHASADSALYWIRMARTSAARAYYAGAGGIYTAHADSAQVRTILQQTDSVAQWLCQLSAYVELEHTSMDRDTILRHKADSIYALAQSCLHTVCDSAMPHLPIRNRAEVATQLHIPHLYAYIVGLAAALLFLLYYKRREESRAHDGRQIAQQQDAIAHLHDTIREGEQEKQHLHLQIIHAQQMRNDRIGRGKALLIRVTEGGQLKNISIEDEQCLVDYYAFAHADAYRQMMAPYHQLSLRHTTYLILCQLGYTNPQIEHILFVQPSTLRNYRLRIKRCLREQ